MAFCISDDISQDYLDVVVRSVRANAKSGFSAQDHEDLAQEIFLESVRSAGDNVVALRQHIAANKRRGRFYASARRRLCSDEVRTDFNFEGVDGFSHVQVKTSVALDPSESIATRDFLMRELAKLPEAQASAFVLRGLVGLTHEEIRQHLGVSLRTVHNLIARATEALQAAWFSAEAA